MDLKPNEPVTVVTASDRLARHLRAAVGDAAQAEGRQVWERPDILPAGAFWRRLANELSFLPDHPADKRVLSRSAVLCRFEALVKETFADNPLLQAAGAARHALDAWLLVRDWQLDADALAADPLAETRWLIEWGRRFERECADAGWLPEYALPDAVLAKLEQLRVLPGFVPRRIRLAGFLEFAPRVRAQWQALQSLGIAIEWPDETRPVAQTVQYACRDVRDENRAVAAWARSVLSATPSARIAVVVPDLASRRAGLQRALIEALAPRRLLDAGEPLPFNVSLGEPLASRALVVDALAVLSLSQRTISFETAARLCRSPYLGFESERRFALEGVMRRDGYAVSTINEWRRLAERHGAAVLAETLAGFADDVRQHAGDALPSEWARGFSRWLERFGWCRGRALDSNEYQAREAWNETLAKLAELDPVLGRVQRQVALGWLNRFASETLFQPRAANAPVQVLGLLEATGMTFDATWVMGMDDETLPASPRPNPFLPIEVQRDKGMPNASAAREHDFARDVFDGLCRSASHVAFSHASSEAGAERRPSPLLREVADGGEPPAEVPALAPHYFQAGASETFIDAQGSPHAGGYVRGGTALLQNQSHCAFRAFALHRLHALEWPTPANGPDAKVRGDIVHRTMEALWSHFRTRRGLAAAIARDDFDHVLRDTVRDVVERVARRESHRWTRGLREIEVERLVNVLRRWFENVEIARPDFDVIEIEGCRMDGNAADDAEVKTVVRAGPLELRGKLDRVDRLPDGSELIIDYKTGEAPKKNDFFGDRPRAPQLPAYLLARKQAGRPIPIGIAVASLKTGKEGLQGVMRVDDPNAAPGIAGMDNVAKAEAVDSWEDAIAHWEQSIHALGEAFAAGEARVDPLRGVCDYCHLSLFCRIREQREFAAGESDD